MSTISITNFYCLMLGVTDTWKITQFPCLTFHDPNALQILIYSCSSLYLYNTLIWKWYRCTTHTLTATYFFSSFFFHTFHPQVAYLYIHHNGERIKESVWMTAVISDQGSRTLVCSTILLLPYCIFAILPYWYFEILHSALYRFSILKRATLLN